MIASMYKTESVGHNYGTSVDFTHMSEMLQRVIRNLNGFISEWFGDEFETKFRNLESFVET